MDVLRTALGEFWSTLAEMSPYLLFGFAVAGVLSAVISPVLVQRHLGGRGLWPVIKSALFGVPLPLCSCSVIPVSMSLYKNGASKAATVAFLLSTPQTGVDSILVTWGLLGPVFAVIRPVMALVTGLVGGVLTDLWDHKPDQPPAEPKAACCCHSQAEAPKPSNRWLAALSYGFVTLPRDIGKSLLIGIVIAAGISMLIPDNFFAKELGTGLWPMIVMMGVGIPLYVCATASVPVAAAMILKGLSPGAALVFLMTGPATNAAGIVTIWRSLGTRAAAAFMISVAGCALASGLLLDWAIGHVNLPMASSAHWMPGPWLGDLSAIVLIGVIGYALVGKLHRPESRMLKPEARN
jgi:uncharacterized membrane protein YraQ (UPF0718 family)